MTALRRLFTIAYASLQGVKVGERTIIDCGAQLSGDITIGSGCYIAPGARLLAAGGKIVIGNDVTVNPYCLLYGHGGLVIGDGVLIAAHATIVPANHGIIRDRPIRRQLLVRKGIVISSDVWIGTGATILDGATISEGCIIAAGCVFPGSKKTEAQAIYGGVPARKIGDRPSADSPYQPPC